MMRHGVVRAGGVRGRAELAGVDVAEHAEARAMELLLGVVVEVPGMADVPVLPLAGGGVPVRELAETTGASGRSSGVRIVDAFEVEVEVEMSAQFEPLVVGRCQQNREGAGIHFCAPARRRAIPYLPFR